MQQREHVEQSVMMRKMRQWRREWWVMLEGWWMICVDVGWGGWLMLRVVVMIWLGIMMPSFYCCCCVSIDCCCCCHYLACLAVCCLSLLASLMHTYLWLMPRGHWSVVMIDMLWRTPLRLWLYWLLLEQLWLLEKFLPWLMLMLLLVFRLNRCFVVCYVALMFYVEFWWWSQNGRREWGDRHPKWCRMWQIGVLVDQHCLDSCW